MNTQKGEVKSIVEKPVNRYHVNAGIYVMEPSVIAGLEKNKYVDMPDVVDSLLKQRAPVGYYEVSEEWLDIGRLDDFKKAQQFVLESFSEL